MELTPVLDRALKAYAKSVSLSKGTAARMLLMRLLVKRNIRAPDAMADGT
jgi:hypothetical protein